MRCAPAAIGAFLLFGACAAGPGIARGEGSSAQQQFDYGLSEMNAGRFSTGCPALDESFHLEPRPGTLFTAATCNAKWGKTASALAAYDQYLALYDRMAQDQKARQRDRKRVALQQRDVLGKRVPTLAVTVGPGTPQSAIVRRDGIVLGGPMLGTALPVDPGEHVVRLELADGRSAERRVEIHDTDHVEVEVPAPAEVSASVAPDATGQKPAPLDAKEIPAKQDLAAGETHASSRRTWTWVSAGIGGAGLGVAAVAGALALSKKGSVSSHCDASGACDTQSEADAGNTGRSFANVETVGLVVGGAGILAAGLLWLTRPTQQVARVTGTGSKVTPYLTGYVTGDRFGPRGGISVSW